MPTILPQPQRAPYKFASADRHTTSAIRNRSTIFVIDGPPAALFVERAKPMSPSLDNGWS
jgi:hypothetical protein